MEKQVLIVSLVCGFLGVFSVILGFTAEVTKINVSDLYIGDFQCYHPSSPAFGCAIVATLFLVVAQILVTAYDGCCGCCKRDPNLTPVIDDKRTLRMICSVFSWITFGVSVSLLLLGADKNGTGGEMTYGSVCYVVKPGVFAMGAIFALIALSLSITSFIIFRTSNGDKQYGVPNNGIVMGSPQFPASGHNQAPSHVNGGFQYPPPGTGGSQYNATTEFTPPGKGSV